MQEWGAQVTVISFAVLVHSLYTQWRQTQYSKHTSYGSWLTVNKECQILAGC